MMLGYIVFKIVMGLEVEDARQAVASGAGEEMKGLLDELDKLAVSWRCKYGGLDSPVWPNVQFRLDTLRTVLRGDLQV
jgi:hypothetical protein